ncbi:MAG: membrane protein insertase YidC [Hyphomicrobiaceae bacterium]
MQPPDQNQKNLLLAIVLSVMVLLGWQMFFVAPKLKEEQERKARQTQTQTLPGQPGVPTATPGATPVPGATPTTTQPTAPGVTPLPTGGPQPTLAMTRDEALKLLPRVAIETPALRGSIALEGGRIDDLVLVKYREMPDIKSPNIVLLSPIGAPAPYYAELSWLAPQGTPIKVPGSDTPWKVESGTSLGPNSPVTLIWDNGAGLTFRRTYTIDQNYMMTFVDSVENKTAAPVALDHRSVLSRITTPKVEGFFILHEGLIAQMGDKGLHEITYAKAVDTSKDGTQLTKPFEKVTGGWFGFTDKYWATALIPDQKSAYDGYITGFNKNGPVKERYQLDGLRRGIAIAPGGKETVTTNLFAGAKEVRVLQGYETALGAKNFDNLVDWGWFYFFTRPLYALIHWLYERLGNFGLAILTITVLVKGGLFWFANKSYASMAKMKKLQPEMERLRERYKDDKMRQQQELMELYKKEKINPAAGCLPMIPQAIVMFALYKVLYITIDARHAPFYGWIKDLAAPDPSSFTNLFSLLPWGPLEGGLLGYTIGAWPLIYLVTMWVQMQLNPQQPDPVQQQIFNWMPVMFTFIMAQFPVGLVIYWAWGNILGLIQQYYINKKHGAEIHLWKNLGIEKLAARFASKAK